MLKYGFPLIAFFILGVLLFMGLGHDPKILPSPLINKPSPDFELPLLGETTKRVSKQSLLGAPYLLNVWASWCVTCREEHSVLQAYAQSSAIQVIGLNWKDNSDDAQRWLNQFGNPYHQVLIDPSGLTGVDFGVYGTPETFLLDAQGVIRFKHVGPLTEDVIEREINPRLTAMTMSKRS